MTDDIQYSEGSVPVPVRLAELLLERTPDWRQYVEVQSEEELVIAVPSRFAPYWPLLIEAAGIGITVRWGNWDIHCDPWAAMHSDDESIAKAVETIDSILSDRLLIVDYWQDDNLNGSIDITPDGLSEAARRGEAICFGNAKQTVRSWTGAYDVGVINTGMLKSSEMTLEKLKEMLIEAGIDPSELDDGFDG